jgi:hypothetical protein
MIILFLAQLSVNTSFTLTLAAAAALVITLIGTTWRVANMLRDVRDEIKGMRCDIQESWTRREQERWAVELERSNRGLPLNVPPVPDSRDTDP